MSLLEGFRPRCASACRGGRRAQRLGAHRAVLLARLGHDRWAEAARLVDQPKAAAIDCLTRGIARVPLSPQALAEARPTATRLVGLLPVNNNVPGLAAGSMSQSMAGLATLTGIKTVADDTGVYCALALALALGMRASMITAPRPDAAAPAANTLVDRAAR